MKSFEGDSRMIVNEITNGYAEEMPWWKLHFYKQICLDLCRQKIYAYLENWISEKRTYFQCFPISNEILKHFRIFPKNTFFIFCYWSFGLDCIVSKILRLIFLQEHYCLALFRDICIDKKKRIVYYYFFNVSIWNRNILYRNLV